MGVKKFLYLESDKQNGWLAQPPCANVSNGKIGLEHPDAVQSGGSLIRINLLKILGG